MLDEAWVHLEDCKATRKALEAWQAAHDRAQSSFVKVVTDLENNGGTFEFTEETSKSLGPDVTNMLSAYTKANSAMLEEFKLSAFDEPLQTTITTFLKATLNTISFVSADLEGGCRLG